MNSHFSMTELLAAQKEMRRSLCGARLENCGPQSKMSEATKDGLARLITALAWVSQEINSRMYYICAGTGGRTIFQQGAPFLSAPGMVTGEKEDFPF